MAIAPINSGDTSARAKINAAIEKANLVDDKASTTALNAGLASLASSVAIEKATRSQADISERLTRQSADSVERNDRIAADSSERAERIAAVAGLEALKATRFEVLDRFVAPGELPSLWTSDIESINPAGLSPSQAAVGVDGKVVRVHGPLVVAPLNYTRLEPGRHYSARFAVRRVTNSPDPANDGVRFGLRWYDRSKSPITGGVAIVKDILDLVVADGLQTGAAVLARNAGTLIDIVAPSSARYVRPFVQVYGSAAVTDVEIVHLIDATDASLYAPDVGQFDSRLTAVEGLDLDPRLSFVESAIGSPISASYSTIADLQTALVPATADAVRLLWGAAEGDGRGGLYRRAVGDGDVQSADGALWAMINPEVLLASAGEAAAGADNFKYMTPALTKIAAELGIFTPAAPWVAHRSLGDKAGETISTRDLGVAPTSGGIPDYTTLFENKAADMQFKVIEVAEPTIILSECNWSGKGNIGISGRGRTQTKILTPNNADGLIGTDCHFCEVRSLSFQHAPEATSGRAIVFDGPSTQNMLWDLYLAGNPGGAIGFIGSSSGQQSGNSISDCLIVDNGDGTDQVRYEWSNDTWVSHNDVGRVSQPGYAATGFRYLNSSGGDHLGNKHWDNENAIIYDGSSSWRNVSNRIEESRKENVVVIGGYDNLLGCNTIHTGSKLSAGSYSGVRLQGAQAITVFANGFTSFNGSIYYHKHAIEGDSACDDVTLALNKMRYQLLAPINMNAATRVQYAFNTPDHYGLRGEGVAAAFSNALDWNNPSLTDWSALQVLLRVAGAPRGSIVAQRSAGSSGGQLTLQVADPSGALQDALVLNVNGYPYFRGLPSSPQGPKSLWYDPADGNRVKFSPT